MRPGLGSGSAHIIVKVLDCFRHGGAGLPLIPALRQQTQADLCEFQTTLIYDVSFSPARTTRRDSISKTNKHASGFPVITAFH